MQYLVNHIVELIAEKEPASGNEAIILVNGFENLKIYSEIATALSHAYANGSYIVNIKLAKNKWYELSKESDTTTVQLMKLKGWVADKDSVTYYRNLHNADILILLGTEDEEDTGGLANCFCLTPDKLVSMLDGHYHEIFERCFTMELSSEDKKTIDTAYRKLFEFVPADITKLSEFSDMWFKQFDTINEFLEEFGKTLSGWGLPNWIDNPVTAKIINKKNNFLRDAVAFISGKFFQKMSQKVYVGMEKKMAVYKDEGKYAADSAVWTGSGFSDYSDFAKTILEFARGENVLKNKEKLLKVDFAVVDDVLKFKVKDIPVASKESETSIAGNPLEVILKTILTVYKDAKLKEMEELASINFEFTSASVVTGYTDVDDDDKIELLYEIWKNICVHVNGIFEYVNQNQWDYYDGNIEINCSTPDFFDPKQVSKQINNTVNVASGTNTLNKIFFNVSLLDKDGNVLSEKKGNKSYDLIYHYAWKFDNEAPWLFDFKDLVFDQSFVQTDATKIPISIMKRILNTMVVKSEQEFFDVYEEETLNMDYDLCRFIMDKAKKTNKAETIQYALLFEQLGLSFCEFVTMLSKEGFYKCLCNNVLTKLNERYNAIADAILDMKFDENLQWIKDAYLQAFTILDKTSYIEDDEEPKCVIIPPWHPASLQKSASQKRFMIDGLTQKVRDYNISGQQLNVDNQLERYIRMTEIQSTIDLFPADGNDYMGVLGTYGDFCVYGNEKNISVVKTRVKDILRKEAIYDEEFKASELTKMNDDAKMIYDILLDYNKAMPSVKCSLTLAFINPPDLQPIISAVSKYTKDILEEKEDAIINLKLSILVRPENKGGKNYLTYWMDEYFAENKNTSVKVYMNEWSKKSELDKLLTDNNDIVFNMDVLHAETFKFIPNTGILAGKVSDCRFPIVYKPSPMSQTSKKRKIELTQTQFSVSTKHTQVVRYKKMNEMIPQETYLAVRESSVEAETKQIIDMLHKKAYWVVCIDKVMDGALLRADENGDPYAIIGFSTGKGMYGQYNLTITARNSILETVEKKLKDRLYKLFHWNQDILCAAVKRVMNEARSLDGISMLSAINQKGTNINEFMAYVMTSMRERSVTQDSALKVIIHLDSYKHWFDNSGSDKVSMRPDFLMLTIEPSDGIIKIKASVIECKTALYGNHMAHVQKASNQVLHGMEQLKELFDPNSTSIERRYWYAQLYRALVFAQVTFSDSSDEFQDLSIKLRSILDGNFEIDWDGIVLGYWVDQPGATEWMTEEQGVAICNIPQQRIQNILLNKSDSSYVTIDAETLTTIDDDSDEQAERESDEEIRKKKEAILSHRKRIQKEHQKKGYETEKKPMEEEKLEEQNIVEVNEGVEVEKSSDDSTKHINDSVSKPFDNSEKEANKPAEDISNARILIGKDRTGYDVYWEFGHKGLSNRHLLITGTSGQGKTYGIQSMLYEVSKSNVSTVVFDYTEGFRKDQLEQKFLDKMESRINEQVVYFTGVPIDPFKRHEIEVAGMRAPEKIADVAQRIASTLTHVYKFGDQQFAAIYDACRTGLQKYGDKMSMRYLESELNESTNKSAKSVVSKMTPFLHTVEFSDERCDWKDILYNESGKLTIFQLTNFVREIQVIITEFMLWDIWHYTKKNGNKDKPFVVVLDEAQNLSHTDNSPSGLILTEGRKFGWSAWYATQSLKVLDDDEVTRLLQSAFKLYFKPTDGEIVSISKQINPTEANDWRKPLTSLKKGECIVVGNRIQKNGLFEAGRPTVTKVTSFEARE